MKARNYILLAASALFIVLSIEGCNTLKNVANTLTNLKSIQFKLDKVNQFALAGVRISEIKSIKDVSITDGLRLTQAFASKSIPAEFTIMVAAKNPNTGGGGSKSVAATITSIDWRLLIDDVETVNGVVSTPIEVPASGETTYIPIQVGLDLYKFFGSKGYDHVANLALAIGGVGSSPARLKLDIRPSVKTAFGAINYPGRITVVDKEFR